MHFFLRIGALSSIDRTLDELGVDPEPIILAHGLSAAMLAEGDRLIAVEQAAAFLEDAARAAGRPCFAIELASRQDVNLLGAFGLLLQTADTVREALQDLENHLQASHVSNIRWSLVRRGAHDALEVTAEVPTVTTNQARLIIELSVAQCFQIMQSVSRGRLELSRVCFRHGDVEGKSLLKRFFHASVEVTADFDGIVFAPGVLDTPVAQADSQIHESVRRLILSQPATLAVDSLADQVKVLIRSLLPTGQCSIERIAACLACDKRTLQRYLRSESDITYQELLDDVRFDVACFYLEESSIPLTQMAQLAGFTEPTNFSRAFRRRFALSPRKWREEHGNAVPHRGIFSGRA